MRSIWRYGLICTLLLGFPVLACEALHGLIGFRLVAASDVEKDQLRELADGKRKVITLRNGLSFRFDKPPRDRWGMGLRATVFVFNRSNPVMEQDCCARLGWPVADDDRYTLLIDDATYEVRKVDVEE